MEPLTVNDLRCGARVLYVGQPTKADIEDRAMLDCGHILMNGHPGLVIRVSPDRLVFVRFVGLESERICEAAFMPDAAGLYPGLVTVSSEEWGVAMSAGWWAVLTSEVDDASRKKPGTDPGQGSAVSSQPAVVTRHAPGDTTPRHVSPDGRVEEDSGQLTVGTDDLDERDALLRQVTLLSEAVTNLERAMERSRDLGVAVGLVMATEGVSRTQAFDLLQVVSQHQKRKLSVVAAEVIETGGLPTGEDSGAIGSSVTCDQLAGVAPQPQPWEAARPVG